VGLGFHIALTREHAKRLHAIQDDSSLKTFSDELQSSAEMKKKGRVIETGRTWDAIHRCLTDGELDPTGGDFPLNHVVLGGKHLHQGDGYTAVFIRPDMTPFIAEALGDVKQKDFREKFDALGSSYTGGRSEKDFGEVWRQLQRLRVFFEDCSQNREAVMFTADIGPAQMQAKSA
jgi:hypothetical protein